MTIQDLINEITLKSFKEQFASRLYCNNMFLVDEWKADTNYNIRDLCYTTNANYITTIWSSKIDANTNNIPSTSSNFWNEEDQQNNIYILDSDITKQMNIRREILFDLCYKRNFNVEDVKYRIIELFGLFVCAGLLTEKSVYDDAGLVNSTSIAETSRSIEYSDFFKKYPWLNNSFGIQAYQIMVSLFSHDYRLLDVVKNNPYDY